MSSVNGGPPCLKMNKFHWMLPYVCWKVAAPCWGSYVPIADRLYDEHLEQLQKEGLIDGK